MRVRKNFQHSNRLKRNYIYNSSSFPDAGKLLNAPSLYFISWSKWSQFLSLQSSLLAHPLPLVESSLPHPRPAGRACLTHRMKSISTQLIGSTYWVKLIGGDQFFSQFFDSVITYNEWLEELHFSIQIERFWSQFFDSVITYISENSLTMLSW
jgi:hypothetical protein